MYFVCTIKGYDLPQLLNQKDYDMHREKGNILSLLESFEDLIDARNFRDEITEETVQINNDSKHDMDRYKPQKYSEEE